MKIIKISSKIRPSSLRHHVERENHVKRMGQNILIPISSKYRAYWELGTPKK